ncbi:MAG: DUF2490 domain-containing protein [Bacteroidetes bacterium]|nr:DUF2490 domain-containing protein [Bacteroidota bacterium]
MRKPILQKHFFLLLAICGLAVIPAVAQHNDLRSWNTFSINYDLTKKLTLNFDQELRLQDNLTRINQLYTNIGATYKLNKYVRVAGVYRFIARYKEDNTFGLRNRFYGDLIVKLRPGRFTYVYRARLQYEWRGAGYGKEYGRVPEIYWRNLFKASYKVNDIVSPYLATEIRFQLQNPRIPYHNGFDRSRFTGGVDLQVTKNSTFGVYYLLQKEWNVIDPETLHVIGLEYSISLD